MYEVVPVTLDQDRLIYQNKGRVATKGTTVYAIRFMKRGKVEKYFTFSYLNQDKAEQIAAKLSADENFQEDANRTHNPQWTLVSEL